MQQALIGGGESVSRQLVAGDPGEVMAADTLRFVLPPVAAEEFQMHRFFRVLVRDGIQQFPNRHFNAQFFPQFAREALLKSFRRMTLAAGKFPQSAEMILRTPLRDEEQTVAEDQAGGNFDQVGYVRFRLSNDRILPCSLVSAIPKIKLLKPPWIRNFGLANREIRDKMQLQSEREPQVQITYTSGGYLRIGKMKLWNHFGGRELIDPRRLGLIVIVLLCFAQAVRAGAIRDLPGFTTTTYGPNDDGSYPCTGTGSAVPPNCTPSTVPIGFSVSFYGNTFDNLYVNNNGNVTFDAPLGEFTPFGMPGASNQIVAAFFADVDTRVGNVVTFGNDTVDGHQAFGVNWFGVGYFDDETDKLNSFQLILINRADRNPGDFDIEFNYDQIHWETGDASGGFDGLGGDSAVAGFSAGTGLPGTYFQLPGSAIPGEFLDNNPAGLIHGSLNTNVPGRYIIPIVNLTNTVLNVERFSQGDSRWGGNTYGNSNFTIQQKGCALSSLAMALNYEGVPTDPAALNALMKNDNDFVGTSVNWDAATRDASDDGLEFHSHRTADIQYLSQILAMGHPVIVGVNLNADGDPGHFVLVIGERNGQFLINDPGHADRTTLDQYGNQFETRGYVGDPPGDVSGFDICVDNAADVLVVDPLGRRTGYHASGAPLEEIPQSAHFVDAVEDSDLTGAPGTDTAHTVNIFQILPGKYQIFLIGTNGGGYKLSLRMFSQSGTPGFPAILEGTIMPGAVTSLQINLTPTGVTFAPFTNDFTLTPLYSFTGGDDGDTPSGMTQGADGNFYGTTESGGAYGLGTVFQATPQGALTTLHSFGAITNAGGNSPDGANPDAGVTQGTDGFFYGTTESGGDFGYGSVFSISSTGTLATSYSFGTLTDINGNPVDGASPFSGLIQGADGNFYGVTESGGVYGYGAIFQISTNGALTTLYSFGTLNDGNGNPLDGANPYAGLAQGPDGSFYGVTSSGGAYTNIIDLNGNLGAGTIFKITPDGAFSLLYTFTGLIDGAFPHADLEWGADGNFYGSTERGGTNNYGTLFRIGTNSAFATLHSFNGLNEGAYPQAPLLRGQDGYFYGASAGAVFQMSANGSLTVLALVDQPLSRLLHGADGSFYGTSSQGGTNGFGSIFLLNKASPPPPVFKTPTETPGAFTLSWSTLAGLAYQVQYKTNLSSLNWINLGASMTATNGGMNVSDVVPPGPQRFYRVVLLP